MAERHNPQIRLASKESRSLKPMKGADDADTLAEGQPAPAAEASEPAGNGDSQSRDRGNWRGRRRRRGGRRDGRERGSERSNDRGSDRGSERTSEPAPEPRYSRPAQPIAPTGNPVWPAAVDTQTDPASRRVDFEVPALPAACTSPRSVAEGNHDRSRIRGCGRDRRAVGRKIPRRRAGFRFNGGHRRTAARRTRPLPSHDHSANSEEQVESASTSVEWNREFPQSGACASRVSVEQPFDLNAARESHEETREETLEDTHHDVAEESHEADRAHERAERWPGVSTATRTRPRLRSSRHDGRRNH